MSNIKEPGDQRDLVVYGRNAVLELLRSGKKPDVIYIETSKAEPASRPQGSAAQIIALAKSGGFVVKMVDRKKLDELAEMGNHQGVAAALPAVEYVELEDILALAQSREEAPFIIIGDEIEDPHNLGALIRTADAAGVHGLVIPKRRSATVNATVYKTSAGACAHLLIAKVSNLVESIKVLKENGVWVYGADMSGDPAWRTDLSGGVALVVGSEGKGLGRLVKQHCDAVLSLPMVGKVNSLNASVAGGILMYEVVRQRMGSHK